MKVLILLIQLCFLGLVQSQTYALEVNPVYSREKALKEAKKLEVVRALYRLVDGIDQDCVQAEVVLPCETDWVTCIEDAWVVRFYPVEKCGFTHDGRLGVTILMDKKSGRVLSRYPEKEYFEDEKFCLAGFDCVYLLSGEKTGDECLNFIHGQLPGQGRLDSAGGCECVKRQCAMKQ